MEKLKKILLKEINKSKSKKGQTIKGTSKDEAITGSKYKDTIYTGAGYDEVYSGKGNDTIIVNGLGTKVLYFDGDSGNNTIKFTKVKNTSQVTLNFKTNGYYPTYTKNGNNLIIHVQLLNSNNKAVTTKQTIVDYFKNSSYTPDDLFIQFGDNIPKLLASAVSSSYLSVYGDKKHRVIGTDGTNYLYGSSKSDTITTGAGYDYVYAGKGNDKINITGNSGKYIYLENGDGNDTVTVSDGLSDVYVGLYTTNTSGLSYTTSNGNLVISRTFDNGKKIVTEKTTLKNVNEDKLEINGYSFNQESEDYEYAKATMTEGFVSRKGNFNVTSSDNNKTIKGNNKKNTITVAGASNSHIFSGAGNDTLNISYNSDVRVNGGAGNDTINISGNSRVVINHAAGDGNDTVDITDSNSTVYLNVSLKSKAFSSDWYYTDYYNREFSIGSRTGFRRSGNDLVFQIPGNNISNKESITFKDFYLKDTYNHTYLNDMDINGPDTYVYVDTDTIDSLSHSWAFWASGIYDKNEKATIYLSEGTSFNNYFEYSGKGNAIFAGSGVKDNYIAKLTNKSNLTIYTNYSGGDEGCRNLVIEKNISSIKTFFNVNRNGEIGMNETNNFSDNLLIFDSKKSLTSSNLKNILAGKNGKGVISINNFFGVNNIGDGYVNIEVTNNTKNYLSNMDYSSDKIYYLNDEALIMGIAQNVATWLSNHSKYADSFDVIQRGSSKDIASLIKIYASADTSEVAYNGGMI